jgi:ethanolamine utilization protein EutN
MLIAKVIGSAVASVKLDALKSSKLLMVSPADGHGVVIGAPLLAIDLVGAGAGELVVVSQGSSARMAAGAHSDVSPVDAAIIGILDSLQIDGDVAFRKD